MLVKYKIGSMSVESYNVSEIANVKGLNVEGVEVEFEVDLKDLPELVNSLVKLKSTRNPNSVDRSN